MALYVPPGARRRRLAITLFAGLVVGLLLGLGIGRSTAPDLAGEVDAVQAQAEGAATALARLPIEYEQALAGTGGESTETILGAVDRAEAELAVAFDAAIWLGPGASTSTDATFDALRQAVHLEESAATFETLVGEAEAEIARTFGLG